MVSSVSSNAAVSFRGAVGPLVAARATLQAFQEKLFSKLDVQW